MKVLVTGSQGYIGKTLCWWLKNAGHEVVEFTKETTFEEMAEQLSDIKFIVHLAGVTHKGDSTEYIRGNYDLTVRLVEKIVASGYDIPIIYASSEKALEDNEYGRAKRMTEDYLLGCPLLVYVFRLDNVIGLGRRDENDSFVSVMADNIINGIEYKIDEPSKKFTWISVFQVCETFEKVINNNYEADDSTILTIPGTEATLRYIEDWYKLFNKHPFIFPTLKDPFIYSLYLLFISHRSDFVYPFVEQSDDNGTYSEVIRSSEGHIALNLVRPGCYVGDCYHIKKVKDFIPIIGNALIRTRKYDQEDITDNKGNPDKPTIIRVLPGCAYRICNEGESTILVMSWCNELDVEGDADIYDEPVEKVEVVEEAEHYYY